jgi:hypothetical protein
MLRNILMSVGFLVAVLPYVGLPYDVTKWIWTFAGLFLMVLIFFVQHPKRRESVVILDEPTIEETPRELDVVRHEDTLRPEMHVERTIVVERTSMEDGDEVTTLETNVTKAKRKRRKTDHVPDLNEHSSPEA